MKKKQLIKRPYSWINPVLEIRETEKYGKGVFAKKNIKKDEMLAIFGGYIKTNIEEEKSETSISDEGVQITEDFSIGILKTEEIEGSSFFNHNCDPNSGFKGQIFLVAIRTIKKNQEVCFDYAMVLSRSRGAKYYKMKCNCGAENCRKFITDNDWKKPEIQKKYKGYFQWYLQEKINKKS